MIKFYSIKKSDDKIKNKIYSSIKKVIKQNNFILEKEVFDFENKFKNFVTQNTLYHALMEQTQSL